MYYHILIKLNDTWIKEYDIENYNDVLEIFLSYLKKDSFFFSGKIIYKNRISEIHAIQTEKNKELLFVYATWNFDESEVLLKEKNITRKVMNEVDEKLKKENLISKISDNHKTNSSKENKDLNKVFIVHGHDEALYNEIARLIEKQGLEAIILHEQVNQSLTIIEKIEKYSDVGYGVVLYTPCDKGGFNKENSELKPRARQNVVLEHGYLLAKIGRKNVAAIVKGDVETPSDINGILYIPYNGDWKIKLFKEMKSVGYDIDMNKI